MKVLPRLLILLALAPCAHAGERISAHLISVFKGKLGKAAIELDVNHITSDSQAVDRVYIYTKHNEPIPLIGSFVRKRLVLTEVGGHRFEFNGYSDTAQDLSGTWTHAKTGKRLGVRIQRQGKEVEVLQKKSLPKYLFRVTNWSEEYLNYVLVSEKSTGRQLFGGTANERAGMEEIVIDSLDRENNRFSVINHSTGRALFGYRIDSTGDIERICCETSAEDSAYIHFPHRYKNGYDEENNQE